MMASRISHDINQLNITQIQQHHNQHQHEHQQLQYQNINQSQNIQQQQQQQHHHYNCDQKQQPSIPSYPIVPLSSSHSNNITTSNTETTNHRNTNEVTNNNNNNTESKSNNNNNDTLKKYRIENESFRLWSYYKPSSKKLLGRGGYGVVMEAIDIRNGSKVAIKKMKNVFAHLNTAKCSLRELTLLMHFNHPNIINVIDCMIPENKNITTYQQVYYVMPKMQSTLKTVCCYSDIEISCNHRCFILYQILNGVYYIHKCDVIHRDLKPEIINVISL